MKKSHFHGGLYFPGNVSTANAQDCPCPSCWPTCLIPHPSADLVLEKNSLLFGECAKILCAFSYAIPFPRNILPTSTPSRSSSNALFKCYCSQEPSHSPGYWSMSIIITLFLQMTMEPCDYRAPSRSHPGVGARMSTSPVLS